VTATDRCAIEHDFGHAGRRIRRPHRVLLKSTDAGTLRRIYEELANRLRG
jgi:hypothetical protein